VGVLNVIHGILIVLRKRQINIKRYLR